MDPITIILTIISGVYGLLHAHHYHQRSKCKSKCASHADIETKKNKDNNEEIKI